MEGLSNLVDRVQHLDDQQARDLFKAYASAENNARAALLALLHADSITFGPRILDELDTIAPVCLAERERVCVCVTVRSAFI